MKPMRVYKFSTSKGKVTMPNKDVFEKSLSLLSDGDYVLQIKKIHKGRSINQLRYYFACLTVVANETGHSVEELHEFCKMKFWLRRRGKIIFTKSTTTADSAEMAELITKVRHFFLEDFGIETPCASLYHLVEC